MSRRQLAQYAVDEITSGTSIAKISQHLAAVLIDTKRVHESELLVRDIAWELETRGKSANAVITSATELSSEILQELAEFIKQKTNVDQVSLQENLDKSVLGGVRIETAVHAWDRTISKRLADIRESF
jgi:ATP synthase F1 delta subunit